jgi:hypothetical protein
MKNEIEQTRLLGFGSSDAKMICSVGKNSILNETAKKRIAQLLGIIDKENITTGAMEAGNEIEAAIFNIVAEKFPNAVSNPRYTSTGLVYENFKVFNHIDIEVVTEKTLIWYEIKSSIKDVDTIQQQYSEQLALHYMLLQEKARLLNKDFELFLVHYDTTTGTTDFQSKKITIKVINLSDVFTFFDLIEKGLTIIDKAIPAFEYNVQNITDESLPLEYKEILPKLAFLLNTAKEYEQQAEYFKEKLKLFMSENNVKQLKNEYFTATYSPATTRASFDSKKLLVEKPEIYKEYNKITSVSPSLRLTLK